MFCQLLCVIASSRVGQRLSDNSLPLLWPLDCPRRWQHIGMAQNLCLHKQSEHNPQSVSGSTLRRRSMQEASHKECLCRRALGLPSCQQLARGSRAGRCVSGDAGCACAVVLRSFSSCRRNTWVSRTRIVRCSAALAVLQQSGGDRAHVAEPFAEGVVHIVS